MISPDDARFGVDMDDVRGQKAAVGEMRRILRLIEHGRLYVKAGGKRERGVLMVGPPRHRQDDAGQGDRSSLHVPIYVCERRVVRDVVHGHRRDQRVPHGFAPRAARPTVVGGCIIFIDEIDALAQRRGGMGGMMGGGRWAG